MLKKRPLPCVFLGQLVKKARCECPRKDIRVCDKGYGWVQQVGACEICESYEVDDMTLEIVVTSSGSGTVTNPPSGSPPATPEKEVAK